MAKVTRDEALDGLKFILIAFVIIGHAIEPSRYINNVSGIIYSVIYSFHMPLFVMLSGYFSKSLNLQKINSQTWLLLETYFIMAVVIGFMMGYGYRIMVRPSISCWYLLSLIFWRYLLYLCIVKLKMNKRRFLFFSFMIALLSFCLPVARYYEVLSLMRTSQFFLFFVVGYCLNGEIIQILRDKKGARMVLRFSALVILMIVALTSSRSLHVLEFHRDSFVGLIRDTDWNVYTCFFYKVLLVGANLVLCSALLTIRKFPRSFSYYGSGTLLFFFIQGVVVHKVTAMLPAKLYFELILSLVVIMLGGAFLPFKNWITNPVTSFVKLKKY